MPHRSTSAHKLSFPIQMVIAITIAAVSISGVFYASTTQVRSDIRDILTRLQMRQELEAAQAKLQEERAAQLRESIEAMRRRQELQQYEIQSLKEIVLTLQPNAPQLRRSQP